MSTKDWKNKELNTLLNEKWGFSMDLKKLNENKMPMKDEPEGEDLNKDGKKGHGKVPAFLEEEEVEEDLNKLKGGLKDYMKNKAKKGEEEDSDEKSKLDEDEKEDKKEKFKKGLRGELDDSKDQKVDPKLKQKIIDSLTISQLESALKKKRKKKLNEQEQAPADQDEKLTTTSGGRYSTKDPEMVKKVQQLARGIIQNPSIIKSSAGIETIIQKMIAALGSSEKTLSQTKMDMAKVKDQNK